MTKQEAFLILGMDDVDHMEVKSENDIDWDRLRKLHRELVELNSPENGGSRYLVDRIH